MATSRPLWPGHLFVIQGDVRIIASDAWLLPTDSNCNIADRYDATLIGGRHISDVVRDSPPKDWVESEPTSRAIPVALPPSSTTGNGNIPWLVNVDGDEHDGKRNPRSRSSSTDLPISSSSDAVGASWLPFVAGVERFLRSFAAARDDRYGAAINAAMSLTDAKTRLANIIAGQQSAALSDGASMPPTMPSGSGGSPSLSSSFSPHDLDEEARTLAEAEVKRCEERLSAANNASKPAFGRGLHLALVPVTQQSGMGRVVELLIKLMTRLAKELMFDIGIVLSGDDPRLFAAIQWVRRQQLGEDAWTAFGDEGSWPKADDAAATRAYLQSLIAEEERLAKEALAAKSSNYRPQASGGGARKDADKPAAKITDEQRTRYEALLPRARLLLSADGLAEKARRGELALFIGAGVSYGAGLPLWGDLIKALASRARMSAAEQAALSSLDFLDGARVLENRLGVKLGPLVAEQVRSPVHSIQHALLAAIPAAAAITTNYDELYEMAREAAGKPVAVIPRSNIFDSLPSQGWLLKMHGDVNLPSSIVLSRDDYLGYDDHRSALAGIVSAMLMTKHMLFIGFSFTDYNFHRIIAAVRSAVRPDAGKDKKVEMPKMLSSPPPSNPTPTSASSSSSSSSSSPSGVKKVGGQFASACMLVQDDITQELWRDDLDMLSLARRRPEVKFVWQQFPYAARQLEIFLDYLVCMLQDGSSYLLSPAFAPLLTDGDAKFGKFLLNLFTSAPDDARQCRAWAVMEEFMVKHGWDKDDMDPMRVSRWSSGPTTLTMERQSSGGSPAIVPQPISTGHYPDSSVYPLAKSERWFRDPDPPKPGSGIIGDGHAQTSKDKIQHSYISYGVDPAIWQPLRDQLRAFVRDTKATRFKMPSTLRSFERRVVHMIAEEMSCDHVSEGRGADRCLVITKRVGLPYDDVIASWVDDSSELIALHDAWAASVTGTNSAVTSSSAATTSTTPSSAPSTASPAAATAAVSSSWSSSAIVAAAPSSTAAAAPETVPSFTASTGGAIPPAPSPILAAIASSRRSSHGSGGRGSNWAARGAWTKRGSGTGGGLAPDTPPAGSDGSAATPGGGTGSVRGRSPVFGKARLHGHPSRAAAALSHAAQTAAAEAAAEAVAAATTAKSGSIPTPSVAAATAQPLPPLNGPFRPASSVVTSSSAASSALPSSRRRSPVREATSTGAAEPLLPPSATPTARLIAKASADAIADAMIARSQASPAPAAITDTSLTSSSSGDGNRRVGHRTHDNDASSVVDMMDIDDDAGDGKTASAWQKRHPTFLTLLSGSMPGMPNNPIMPFDLMRGAASLRPISSTPPPASSSSTTSASSSSSSSAAASSSSTTSPALPPPALLPSLRRTPSTGGTTVPTPSSVSVRVTPSGSKTLSDEAFRSAQSRVVPADRTAGVVGISAPTAVHIMPRDLRRSLPTSSATRNTPKSDVPSDLRSQISGDGVSANGPGHVFISHTDLRRLACDTWLVPSGGNSMSDRWMFPENLAGSYCGKQYKQLGRYPVPSTVRSLIRGENLPALDQRCVAPVTDWPSHRARPYLVWTVVAEIDVLLDNVWQYLVAVAVDLRHVRPRNARARHLVALPVVGTGLGGLRMQTGLVTRRLLPVLYEASRRFGYDVVLVCWDEPTYSAAQFARLALDPTASKPVAVDASSSSSSSSGETKFDEKDAKDSDAKRRDASHIPCDKCGAHATLWCSACGMHLCSKCNIASHQTVRHIRTPINLFYGGDAPWRATKDNVAINPIGRGLWPELHPDQISEARRLAQLASKGNLSLFFAPVSSTNLSYSPRDLLRAIAAERLSAEDLEQFSQLHPLDQGRYLEQHFGSNDSFMASVWTKLNNHEFSQYHTLLAKLPCNEIMSTSQDCQFEECAHAIERDVTVLPAPKHEVHERWMMKLNGSIRSPDTMTLTRDQFEQSKRRRSVLAACVQALLITKHFLFVGVPFDDPLFHEAIDAVRAVIRSSQQPSLTRLPSLKRTAPPSPQPPVQSLSSGSASSVPSSTDTPSAAATSAIIVTGATLPAPPSLIRSSGSGGAVTPSSGRHGSGTTLTPKRGMFARLAKVVGLGGSASSVPAVSLPPSSAPAGPSLTAVCWPPIESGRPSCCTLVTPSRNTLISSMLAPEVKSVWFATAIDPLLATPSASSSSSSSGSSLSSSPSGITHGGHHGPSVSAAEAAAGRRVEIFLDCVLAHIAQSSTLHLLDPRFSPSGADYRLKAHLSHKLGTLFTWSSQKLMGRLQALEDFRMLMYRLGLPPRHLDPLTTQQSMIRI